MHEVDKKMALDVYLAEYSSCRDLVHTQIQQDRITLSFAISVLVALPAVVEIFGKNGSFRDNSVLWFILVSAPILFSILGVMNARSIQAGVEVNAYILLHLKKKVSGIFDDCSLSRSFLRAEDFYPRVDSFHNIPGDGVITKAGGIIRAASGWARLLIFLSPSIFCLIMVVGQLFQTTCCFWELRYMWLPVMTLISISSVFCMLLAYLVLSRQLATYLSITNYSLEIQKENDQSTPSGSE